MKIAIIGAGSVGFTRKLVGDVLCVPELRDGEIALTDIDPGNLAMVNEILERMVAANALPTRIVSSTDRRRALEGARYVINCSRIGGLKAFADDIRIPLQDGVDQCVGDTICAGGILYGQRSIPAVLDFCKDIREVSEPGAWLLNYANPMAMNTWAAIDHGKVRTVGLCHGVQHGWRQIAEALGGFRSALVLGRTQRFAACIGIRLRFGQPGSPAFLRVFRARSLCPIGPIAEAVLDNC
jgi:alpha-galactosidase